MPLRTRAAPTRALADPLRPRRRRAGLAHQVPTNAAGRIHLKLRVLDLIARRRVPVPAAEIAESLLGGTADVAADRLLDLALQHGAPDNVAVVVADVVAAA
jgi:hypothetical protein